MTSLVVSNLLSMLSVAVPHQESLQDPFFCQAVMDGSAAYSRRVLEIVAHPDVPAGQVRELEWRA